MNAPETDPTFDPEPYRNGDPLPDALDRKLSAIIHETLARIADAANIGDVEDVLAESRHLRTLVSLQRNRRLIQAGRIREFRDPTVDEFWDREAA